MKLSKKYFISLGICILMLQTSCTHELEELSKAMLLIATAPGEVHKTVMAAYEQKLIGADDAEKILNACIRINVAGLIMVICVVPMAGLSRSANHPNAISKKSNDPRRENLNKTIKIPVGQTTIASMNSAATHEDISL
jgi:hypothetical protein